MVFVFGGLDIPVFEILFVVSVLMIVGLTIIILGVYYILKEVQAMRGLIQHEEKDIQEFDVDIQKLEKSDSKKDEIAQYIKACQDRGYSMPEIRKTLLKNGWDEKIIAPYFKVSK